MREMSDERIQKMEQEILKLDIEMSGLREDMKAILSEIENLNKRLSKVELILSDLFDDRRRHL